MRSGQERRARPYIDEIIILAVLVIGAIGSLAPSLALRVPLTLPLIFFVPGAAALLAFMPHVRIASLSIVQLALVVGLSLSIVASIVLGLNQTAAGLTPAANLSAVAIVTLALLTIRRLRYTSPGLPNLASSGRGLFPAVAVVVLMVLLALVIAFYPSIHEGDSDSEMVLFIVGSDGKPDSLPQRFEVGTEGFIDVGVQNRGREAAMYSLALTTISGEGVVFTEKSSEFSLAPESESITRTAFNIPEYAGIYRVEILLTTMNSEILSAYLWIEAYDAP